MHLGHRRRQQHVEDDNTLDDGDTYCTPVSSRLDLLLYFDGRFLEFL